MSEFEFRWAEGRYEALPSLARELIESKANVLAATGGYISALAAKHATADVPIVFISGGDALRLGLVKTMNRPEGNLTGVNLFFGALGAKQIELLRLMVPKADNIAILANPTNPTTESDIAECRDRRAQSECASTYALPQRRRRLTKCSSKNRRRFNETSQ